MTNKNKISNNHQSSNTSSKKGIPNINSELTNETESGTRPHNLSFGNKQINVVETKDVEILYSWIQQLLLRKPRSLGFSVHPGCKSQLIASISILHNSNCMIFKGLQALTALPDVLDHLFQTLTIEFIGYEMVSRDTKDRFSTQLGCQLGSNFTFLTMNDKKN